MNKIILTSAFLVTMMITNLANATTLLCLGDRTEWNADGSKGTTWPHNVIVDVIDGVVMMGAGVSITTINSNRTVYEFKITDKYEFTVLTGNIKRYSGDASWTIVGKDDNRLWETFEGVCSKNHKIL